MTQPFALTSMVEESSSCWGRARRPRTWRSPPTSTNALPERVLGDAARLRQVLLNLAGNAIKFTDTGGVGVVVEAGAAPGEIVFEVRDTGIGIAPEQQERIFHEFEQADGGRRANSAAPASGLAISQRIVERMGGSIEVESTPGKGSNLPRYRAAAAGRSAIRQASRRPTSPAWRC